MEFDLLGEMSHEKDCWWWTGVQHPETSVTINSPSHDSDISPERSNSNQEWDSWVQTIFYPTIVYIEFISFITCFVLFPPC